MPNWCINYLTIHADENLLNQIRDFIRSEESEFDFTKILPIPKEKENDSYEWRCENWGTKWNAAYIDTYENGFSFETAWTPCRPIIAELARIFPEAEFWFQYNSGFSIMKAIWDLVVSSNTETEISYMKWKVIMPKITLFSKKPT